jgi:hypothetical protein
MKNITDLHRTNELVPETGSYICEQGEAKDFREGELFSNCPVSGEHTTWRHADHTHKTGDPVTESGMYVNSDGNKLEMNKGDTFPVCPVSGRDTTWKHSL